MPTLDVREIMKILPHRYPLLLIDRITELQPFAFARGYKNVTANEPMLQGHFPGNPLFPGVYMIEALAQLGGTTILEPGDMARKVPYLAAVDKAKFKRPVVPGDRLDMEARVTKTKLNIGWVSAEAKVDGKVVVSAELTFSITIDPSAFANDATVLHL
ncbi:3-hydroxyacyl-[acyl-carrier-protein] dehydratase FabZ [Vulcanimicrobium alpinum]|uniref:3-hydroxyacyl-[acyl-carrier-protein] dehydratase FabZ n=1 Tax=Vulcanimicrobium alpinum TaxID=3016050 RepID=A0AAN2C861_UNVUL|nr:3-hydroxyacyl-ACP dehydratase FabZ [Vulcanimicrobium alpinum]BDE04736.1 3-hydroxyacyl-[acyl-carrier-protein] dehydratase FabZ [Vulcanimicrobium alpinum]